MKAIDVLVVVDDASALPAWLSGRAATTDLTFVPTDPAHAATAIAELCDSPVGCLVVGVGAGAGAALDASAEHGNIHGFVCVAGELDRRHIGLLADWPELPLLSVASAADRTALDTAVSAYLAASHPASDLLVDDHATDAQVLAWLSARAAQRVDATDVMFTTSDGWEIHGTLRVPGRDEAVPGVVLLHTGRSDRTAYARLERLLTDAGLAVLNIDWRGRGESTNLGTYFDLDDATKAAAWRDAAAALDTLAADRRVDATRLAAVGCVHGAEYAVRAAWRDRRVRALVILTGYRPAEPEEAQLLAGGEVDVLFVTATGHTVTTEAMHQLHGRAPRGSSRMMEYPGSAIGYQLFEQDTSLEPQIVTWLGESLR
jgi:dienelactone hydrolase